MVNITTDFITRQVRKITRAEKLKLFHESAFDLVEVAHPGPRTVEDGPHKAKRRAMLCMMIDVAIDHRIKKGGYQHEIDELIALKNLDKE